MTTFYAYQRIDQTGKKWWLREDFRGNIYQHTEFNQRNLFEFPLGKEDFSNLADYEVIIFDLIPRLPQGS